MTQSLDYDALSALIAGQQWWFQPAELHGILTGLAACNALSRREEILCTGAASPIARKTFTRLAEHIENDLSAPELRFRLLLPQDSCNDNPKNRLRPRGEAIIAWAEGFLLAEKFIHRTWDKECRSFLADLAEIARLDCRLNDTEENRRQLTALEEHCRMGALMLYAYSHRRNHT